MKIFFIIVLSCLFGFCYSQPKIDTSKNCSSVLARMSYFWKLDSLGSNGYRDVTYKELAKCKIDSVNVSLLFERFGKPNEVVNSTTGTYYLYYTLDTRQLPRKLDYPAACWYIGFVFNNNDPKLKLIGTGSIDL